jgi:hypothetical protein
MCARNHQQTPAVQQLHKTGEYSVSNRPCSLDGPEAAPILRVMNYELPSAQAQRCCDVTATTGTKDILLPSCGGTL